MNNIEYYANELINNLGRKFSYESDDYKEYIPTYEGKYISGYGIEIHSTYTDSTYSEFDDLDIKFKDRIVYSKRKHIYIEGLWEELLKTLYEKIPEVLEKRKEASISIGTAYNLYKYYIKPIYKNKFKINNKLMFDSYEEYNPYHGYGDSTTYHHTVKENGKIVLDVIDNSYSFNVSKYIPGDWEDEIIEFYNSYTNHETREEHDEALKLINKLKNQ